MTPLDIKKNTAYKHYNEADKIIQYLLDPSKEIDLTDTEKKTLDIAKNIHGLRLQFHKKADCVKMIVSLYNVTTRYAYNLMNITEEIFGKVEGVHKDYERNFLLEVSRENIKKAMQSGRSNEISKALIVHYKIAGLEDYIVDMPDFSALEQHEYIINLTNSTVEALKQVLKSGAVKLSDVIPPPSLNIHTEDVTPIDGE